MRRYRLEWLCGRRRELLDCMVAGEWDKNLALALVAVEIAITRLRGLH